ncbi:Uncharacterised protein [Mycobacterium tuberculosis]|nr:Uncharacterised protein [Mycobacterium tuberculosis]
MPSATAAPGAPMVGAIATAGNVGGAAATGASAGIAAGCMPAKPDSPANPVTAPKLEMTEPSATASNCGDWLNASTICTMWVG